MDPRPDYPLAARFFQRLAAEEELLREACRTVNEVHAALRSGAPRRIDTARARQEVVADALRVATLDRVRAADALGADLGIPRSDICLSTLAARLPGAWAAGAWAAQTRLTDATAELSDAVRRNATLVASLRSYFRGVFADLTGGGPPVERYGPAGTLVGTAGVAIQARG